MDTFFDSVFSSSMNVGGVFASLGLALLIGVLFAWICSFRLRADKGVFITGSLMPIVMASVFVLTGYFLEGATSVTTRLITVAVAFGLIRFRSINGKAEEILFLFMSVAIGFAFGLGYLAYGVIIGLGLSLIYFGITFLPIFAHPRFQRERLLKVTIPESLDYSDVFDASFDHYAKEHELIEVKTTNMGSMFRLSYRIVLKDPREEKEFMDELRTKNGNLEISILPYVDENKHL
mgnify:CR=1 FL=1